MRLHFPVTTLQEQKKVFISKGEASEVSCLRGPLFPEGMGSHPVKVNPPRSHEPKGGAETFVAREPFQTIWPGSKVIPGLVRN